MKHFALFVDKNEFSIKFIRKTKRNIIIKRIAIRIIISLIGIIIG